MSKDLATYSRSYADLVREYEARIKGVGELASEVGGNIVKQKLNVPDGVPKDVEDRANAQIKQALSHLARLVVPDLATKAEKAMDRAGAVVDAGVRSAADAMVKALGPDARKLVKVAELVGLDPAASTLRLVRRGITFAQIVHNPWSWSGALIEARLGSVLTPKTIDDIFVIYAPEPPFPVRSSFEVKIIAVKQR